VTAVAIITEKLPTLVRFAVWGGTLVLY